MINPQVIKFAADTSNYGLEKNSNFVATHKNKLCGDKITVELKIKKQIIKKNELRRRVMHILSSFG
ncbi:hypothetical protein OAL70_03215 [Pelagibacteraceae bacterium]|nr:hypothetical protein [Pelagibacteraceae bacterium]